MTVLVFIGVAVLILLAMHFNDKVRSYNDNEHSVWTDGENVIIKPKDATDASGGFGKRLE